METVKKIKLMTTSALLLLSGLFLTMNVAVAGSGNLIKFEKIANLSVKVPAGLTPADVLMAIKYGLIEERWDFNKGTDKELEATLNIRTHQLKVKLSYDVSSIHFVYIASKNLGHQTWQDDSDYPDFPDGTVVIHKNCKLWMEEAQESIEHELKRMLVSRSLL